MEILRNNFAFVNGAKIKDLFKIGIKILQK